mgnify:CR=1 FL=1
MNTNQEIENQKQYMEKVKNIIKDKKLKYTILTMGCQLNENDSEKICGMLEQMGYTKTEDIKEANIAIFNTCCVRENAEERLFGKVGELKNLKEKNNLIIAIGGCMMQEEHILEKIKRSFHYVDIVFGTHTLHKLPQDLYSVLENQKRVQDVIDVDGSVYEDLPISRNSKTQGSVTIMYGCNNFCSYCIVPYVRGRERSRKPKDIIKEVKELANQGYKEIMLLGQNVNSYNGGDGYTFANLLRDIDKIDGIDIVRFMSPHPKDFKDDVIDAIRDCKSVCKVIHLPLQSGSTNVLKLMNRRYNKEEFLSMVDNLRDIPDISLTTDLIVGFPNEGEEEFNETIDTLKKIGFTKIHTFPYSKRKGTPAAIMDNQVFPEEKKKRVHRILDLSNKYEHNFYESKIGKIYDGVVEIHSNGTTIVHTSNFIPVIINDIVEEGTIVDVKIEKVEDLKVYGRIV